ncbi:DNA topoisomerase I [Nakamurella panacisegetis]|uniref:DNA topoisomerase 1 n=1 Tax=Nakamurella panacisegetis TaxID=1090615 RepID=A0A1H0NBV2_9ACTN|nr:type I DNA topoisomerase [Nakamurella panacisegetis]SDO90192.1 DNA topoisomerase I [Nakamurella panacisegetis]
MATRKAAATHTGVRLVVVESPAKAKTISQYLGEGYIVESSVGHIRDLPRNAADVPAKYKGEPWARLGVNTEHNFEPIYVVSPEKKAQVAKLKSLLAGADELYLATDEDREGEAIAWHLLDTLKPKVPVKRMVFHEITPAAIRAAAEAPRELDNNLVDAQETRRILDRLYGYEVSPVLWKKVGSNLSAGRVQSVATRIIVERERARMAFRSGTYWGIDALLAPAQGQTFTAALNSVDGKRLASGRDFDENTGALKTGADVLLLDEDGARTVAAALESGTATVTSVEEKPYTRRPYPPFMTSTLQQEAGRKLGFSSERTMRTAQRLYESGYITYMRTDSTTLSQTALDAARSQARELYGSEYVPPAPRQYTRKVKNAQEAHEAIRPAGENFRTPGQVASGMGADEFRLYELIWQRTIASQMVDARGLTLSLRITAPLSGVPAFGSEALFTASGRTITFPGFLRAYVETVDAEAGGEADDAERRLPNLKVDEKLAINELTPGGHSTTPPARYTEPSLIKALEDLGIGRPSTYTSIIRTITERGYAWRKGQALVPSWIAFAVVGLLEQHFSRLVDYNFTAAMEDELDGIAEGRLGRTAWLSTFYFGGDTGPEGSVSRAGGLKKLVGENLEDIDARLVNSLPLLTDDKGRQVTVRVGRYGPYLERPLITSEGEIPEPDAPKTERANLPEDLAPDEVTAEVVDALFEQAEIGDVELGPDPVTGHMIVAKDGRYGPYVTEILPEDTPTKGKNAVKPRTASLFKSMSLESITLDSALQLLTLPRVVGTDPATGEEITAQNGRYGPYLRKGTDSRSIAEEADLFTVTLDQALAIYAQPKTRGRQAAAAAALREVGIDPTTEKPMVIKDGRFGPYVTDGETNASLRKGDEVETITVERSAELLAERRARGPAPKRAAAKKPAAKKPAAKGATKATATKAAAATKPAARKPAAAKGATATATRTRAAVKKAD